MALLEIADIHSFYGKSHVLEGVSLTVGEGELVTLLGRNGAGKTTTLKSVSGIVRPKSGSVRFDGRETIGREIHEIARAGIALVPEHRGVFALLTVEENLRIAVRDGWWKLSDVYDLFPRLYERRRNGGNALSGGEQQMLSIARALLNNPRLLLLDEPTEGLAPVIVDEIVKVLVDIKRTGMSVLLVEQNLAVCEKLGDRHYVLEQGRIVYSGSAAEFAADHSVRDRYLALNG
ncbi:leucine/isoleucine/valine transporter subunit; ATP-binding component of ABC superfamily [uncultured Alphaproteobacteria bacterium]|uniref:Leucine/isoleucine/valine transporter subunit ATP-binding component of ABC superfamily n=1 Tax=uncultured Alphaproteobacteria bacterium TaxID=91750 RepID=A0A212IYD4_9PROT|nr:leucine/isoleucine/valine transporter subunit; ATP-binding component of ABC superfamily [uncultured Alphaproteobacteria bacterium]